MINLDYCLQTQQDGAMAHTAKKIISFLHSFFFLIIICFYMASGFFIVSTCRPAVFIWGYVKCQVFAHNPVSMNELKTKIIAIIQSITVKTL